MDRYRIAVIDGDGIGPEIMREALLVLDKTAGIYGFGLEYEHVAAGGAAIDAFGEPLPQRTLDICRNADSVLLSAVGGPKWDGTTGNKRPERALLGLRSGLGLFVNLRPATLWKPLREACPLKDERTAYGIDLVVVRELTGGIYFGNRGRRMNEAHDCMEAFDEEAYAVYEVERICRKAFALAEKRRRRVTSVDKANVLESSRLWRETFHRVAKDYPHIATDDMFVDNASMQLVLDPSHFDVIVTSNLFGDILSDEAGAITGSIGMLPSASIGAGTAGMYEPVHGSAPELAGKSIANPLAMIGSAAMMLRYSLGERNAADAIDKAIARSLDEGARTKDIARAGERVLTTDEMGSVVRSFIK